jgi:hypothetical protein
LPVIVVLGVVIEAAATKVGLGLELGPVVHVVPCLLCNLKFIILAD